ncbi:TPA: nicotinate phosphoribosyltransferase [Clostridium botulinum]|nr:nicotinate phosphoribosyltransferase [Clostridium botulinum]
MNSMLLTDFYKTIHHHCYVEGLEYLTSYWTPRMSRTKENEVVMFGLQGFIKKYLIQYFNDNFFNKSKEEIINEYKRIIKYTMGENYADTEHIERLHDLGYLPLEIKAISEGTLVPIKVPMIQIKNTIKGFGWLVNYLETFMSCNIWLPITSATTGHAFRKIINGYYDTSVEEGARDKNSACGDFSMRGMTCLESAINSSAGHLLSFTSTATIPVIPYLEKYYNCNVENEVIGLGTPSTEHSVMSSYGKSHELDCYKRLINEQYPKGNLSIVSDTYDYWSLLTKQLPKLKEGIMKRDGKVIIRPDSGNPVDIICGDNKARKDSPAYRGSIEILWDIFGGYINKKGYKVLDSHIGLIYGDSITVERCEEICERLIQKGFTVSNVTFGVGSYSYQYNTRDTYSFALKATHAVVDGKERFIFKEPQTDSGNFKKSQKGMCIVYKDKYNNITYKDELFIEEVKNFKNNLLTTVFKDGEIIKEYTLEEIRQRLNGRKF